MKDAFTSCPAPERLRQSAFRALSATQDHPSVQIQGTAVALLAMCDATGVDVRQLLESTERLIRDIDGPFSSQIRAIREYARNEIGRR